MSCSLVLRLVALVSVFALVAEGRRHMVDDDGSDGNIVSCKDSCEVCATGLKADDRVLASEFKSCNECGGVRWTVECTIETFSAETIKVKVGVEAGDLVHLNGPYALMADCNENLLLIEQENRSGQSTDLWKVLTAVEITDESNELRAEIPTEGQPPSPDPLGLPVEPTGRKTISCVADKG